MRFKIVIELLQCKDGPAKAHNCYTCSRKNYIIHRLRAFSKCADWVILPGSLNLSNNLFTTPLKPFNTQCCKYNSVSKSDQ